MLTWPAELFPIAGGYAPFVRSLSGGQALSSFEQVQPQLSDRWQASYSFHLGTSARVLALRALLGGLRGRAGTVGLPAFDRNRAPRSAATPGSPLGTVVTNPPFVRRAVMAGYPVGVAVTNPPFVRSAVTHGLPLGSTVASPPFWHRWPAFEGLPYEFTALPAITGTITVISEGHVSLAPTGSAPAAGQYVTLFGAKRLVISALFAGGAWLLRLAPVLAIAADTTSDVTAATGVATIAASDRFTFAASSGVPRIGDRVTLIGETRTLTDVLGGGPYLCVFKPVLIIAPDVSSDVAAASGAATILGFDRFSFAASSGVPQIGDRVTLFSVVRTLTDVLGSGPYTCIFTPALTIGANTPGSVAAVVNANAAINAVSLDVHITTGVAPTAGHLFSLGNRLHTIVSFSSLGGSVYRCAIWPWLRAATTGGDTVNFGTPLCEMRLASDAEGAAALLGASLAKSGTVTLSFDEASAT